MPVKKNILKFILGVTLIALLAATAYASFFVWKINSVEKKIDVNHNNTASVLDTFKNLATQNSINLKGMADGRINILLLGIAGSEKGGKNLTDTIMIVSINTKTDQVAMFSIPRDLYIELPEENFAGKINSVYEHGLSLHPEDKIQAIAPMEKAIKTITSLDMDYWAVVNFDGFQKVIDTLGGINVMNERDILDPTYPGPGYSYETFQLAKGLQHLDGSTALKYARMRHNDPQGDFGRAKRQQQVLQAVKNKAFSTGTLLDAVALNSLLDTLANNIQTDISNGELSDFLQLVKKLDTANITNVVLDAWNSESLLKVSHVSFDNLPAFVLIPRVGNWSETQELAKNIFDLNEIKNKRDKIASENATVAIINQSGNAAVPLRIKNLLQKNFGYKNVITLSAPDKNTLENRMLYDLTNGAMPFTLSELTGKLPAPASYSLDSHYAKIITNSSANIVLVIGKDLINKYNMAEDSVADYTAAKDTNAYNN